MGTLKKDFIIGFLIALFATFGGAFLYLEYFAAYSFGVSLELIRERSLHGKLLALAAIPNLFVFFVFIKKKQDYRARGVLMASILTALVTFVLKFL